MWEGVEIREYIDIVYWGFGLGHTNSHSSSLAFGVIGTLNGMLVFVHGREGGGGVLGVMGDLGVFIVLGFLRFLWRGKYNT